MTARRAMIRPAAALSLGLAILAAGCGDEGEDPRLAQLEQEIARIEERNRALERRLAEAQSAAGEAEQLRVALAKAEARVGELEQAPGLAEDEGEAAATREAARERLAEAIAALADAEARLEALADEAAGAAPRARLRDASASVDAAARTLGLDPDAVRGR